MWLTLFVLAAVLAIAFCAVLFILQPRPSASPRWANFQPGTSELLLYRRMKDLALDPGAVARADPALFRQLEARCKKCASKDRCTRELAGNSSHAMRWPWSDYCPNRPMLNLLSTLQGSPFDFVEQRHPASYR